MVPRPMNRLSSPTIDPSSLPYHEGDRVRISNDYHWAQGALGTVVVPDAGLEELSPPGLRFGGNVWRLSKHVDGDHVHYAVEFDVPQLDGEGDGPYSGAEIDGNFLEHAEE